MNVFTNFKNDTKKIWNAVNQLRNNHKKSYINYMSLNNKILRKPSEISEAFNEYYTNIAPKLDQNIPPATSNPLNFLRGNYPASMSVPPVLPQDVTNIIKSLKNKKGNLNEIPVSLIKANSEQLAIPLSLLFNHSVQKGVFPRCLKHATVIPIHKTGTKDNITNYRPISLLNVFSKVFEKLMKKSLTSYIESKSILKTEQHGFRQNMSNFRL